MDELQKLAQEAFDATVDLMLDKPGLQGTASASSVTEAPQSGQKGDDPPPVHYSVPLNTPSRTLRIIAAAVSA